MMFPRSNLLFCFLKNCCSLQYKWGFFEHINWKIIIIFQNKKKILTHFSRYTHLSDHYMVSSNDHEKDLNTENAKRTRTKPTKSNMCNIYIYVPLVFRGKLSNSPQNCPEMIQSNDYLYCVVILHSFFNHFIHRNILNNTIEPITNASKITQFQNTDLHINRKMLYWKRFYHHWNPNTFICNQKWLFENK